MSRYRTVLKKCYITEEQNEIVNNLIEMTNHLNFSSYARKMLFKRSPIYHYCVELMIEYEKKTSKQVKELVKRLNKKTR